ncbi:MAG: efflux RND transporter periplasmic adaptor subunit [Patescibacteria group bacterium]
MKKIISFSKKYRKYLILAGILLLIVLYFIFGRSNNEKESFVVKRADVSQSVILSGKVSTTDKADLGFAASGRISKIYVKNNQDVTKGQTLAQLEIGDLLADLKIKQLNSKTSNVDLEDAKEELARVVKQEKTKVENAYRTLLSEGLELIPDESYSADAPTISGIYDGLEGQYKIKIRQYGYTGSDFEILTFGLEEIKKILNEEGPTVFGTKGLYISFGTSDLSDYEDTVWYLNIPNKASSDYVSNLNAYNAAKDARDVAVKNAEFKYQKLLTADDGGASVAQAEIQKINAEIAKNTIQAPFAGKVTNIEKEVGENASTGERVISILGEDQLEVVLQVSELDVSKLIPNTVVKVKLDSLPNEEFIGTLKTINSRDTEIDGVPVYEAFVELKPDERIKTGMSAVGSIVIDSKVNVLSIPAYFIKKVGDKSFVSVKSSKGSTTEREVTTGLLGTDSSVEVLTGLTESEEIVSPN